LTVCHYDNVIHADSYTYRRVLNYMPICCLVHVPYIKC